MKMLVIGGAGYVGSKIAKLSKEYGSTCTVLDPAPWTANVIRAMPGVQLIQRKYEEVELGQLLESGYDALVYLALPEQLSISSRGANLNSNLQSFRTLCSQVSQYPGLTFIFASSCSVYGARTTATMTEDSHPRPDGSYANYKYDCERIVHELLINTNSTYITRAATVCGVSDRMRFDLTFNKMILSARRHQSIELAAPNRIRPTVHVEDLARAYWTIAKTDSTDQDVQILNLAFENRSLLDHAKAIAKKSGSSISVVSEVQQDLRTYQVQSDKIGRLFGFTPKLGIEIADQEIARNLQEGLYDDVSFHPRYYNRPKYHTSNLVSR